MVPKAALQPRAMVRVAHEAVSATLPAVTRLPHVHSKNVPGTHPVPTPYLVSDPPPTSKTTTMTLKHVSDSTRNRRAEGHRLALPLRGLLNQSLLSSLWVWGDFDTCWCGACSVPCVFLGWDFSTCCCVVPDCPKPGVRLPFSYIFHFP